LRSYPPPFAWIQRYTLARLPHILAISEEVEQVLRDKGYRGKVSLLPHAVNLQGFLPGRNEARRAELGLEHPVIGYLGRLEEEKGIFDLLRACDKLEADGVEFHLLLVGEGTWRERSEAYAREHFPPGRVLHLGYAPPESMPEHYQLCDVVAVPSRTTRTWKEQFGRVLLEAWACALPVVGSDSGNIPLLIEETGGGLVFPEGDPAALARALETLLQDQALREEYGERGRRVVAEKYTLPALADTLYDLFSQAALPTAGDL
jgi:glycosyltransferase involved in cell wall biosynthesis